MLARHVRSTHKAIITTLLLVVTIILGAGVSYAASSDDQPASVTLDAVLDHAFRSSTVADLARTQLHISQQQANEMRAPLRPQLNLEANATQIEQTQYIDPFCFTLDLPDWTPGNWNLPDGEICLPEERMQIDVEAKSMSATVLLRGAVLPTPLVTATRSLADLSGRSAEADYDRSIEDLALQIVDLYYGILQAESGVELLTAALEEAELQLKEIEWQEQVGSATAADTLEATAKVLQLQAQLIGMEGTVQSLRIRLNQLAGYPLNSAFELERPRDKPPVVPSVERSLRLAADKRPDLVQAQVTLEQAVAHQTIVRMQEGPSLQLFGTMTGSDMEYTVGLDRHGFGQVSVKGTHQKTENEQLQSDAEGWVIGVTGSWALSDGGKRRAKLEQAALQVHAATLHLELLQSGLEAELRQFESELHSAKGALDAARKAHEAMQEAEARMTEMFARGAVSKRQVLQIQVGLLQADQTVLEAERAYAKARMDYMRTAGLLFEDWF